MIGSRAAPGMVLGLIVMACGSQPSVPPPSVVPDPPATAAAVAEPSVEPSLDPTPRPTLEPPPTPQPVPPKPTGLRLAEKVAETCEPSGICSYRIAALTLTWTAPMTRGVEVRVYGVTKCFRPDAKTGTCLRTHTTLPDAIRVLLAKGPAAKGKLRWVVDDRSFVFSDGCAVTWRGEDGTLIYSIVVAAYNAGGHSIFAIADAGTFFRNPDRCDPGTW